MPESERRSGFTSSKEVVSRLVENAERQQRAAKHKRDRSWDERRVKATYDLPVHVKEDIKNIAEQEGVPAYEIARLFLEFSLSVYHGKGLEAFGVEKRIRSQDFTLFPK